MAAVLPGLRARQVAVQVGVAGAGQVAFGEGACAGRRVDEVEAAVQQDRPGRGAALGGFVRAPWQALVLGRELLAGLDRTDVPARQAAGMLAALRALGQSQGWPVYAETLPQRADLEPSLLAGLVAWRPDPRDLRKA